MDAETTGAVGAIAPLKFRKIIDFYHFQPICPSKKLICPPDKRTVPACLNGSKTAKIVGLFILSKLTSKFGIGNMGLSLYRDDGLASI